MYQQVEESTNKKILFSNSKGKDNQKLGIN